MRLQYQVNGPSNVQIKTSSEKPVEIWGLSKGERHLLHVAIHQSVWQARLHNCEALEVESKGTFTCIPKMSPVQHIETYDHKEPPAPKLEMNYLAKLRRKFRQELGATRESFLERDFALPDYEVEDDALFEEEEAEAALHSKQDPERQNVADEAAKDEQSAQTASETPSEAP